MSDLQFFQTPQGIFLIFLLLFWVIPWKGVALWRAARNNHRIWFLVLLVVNTFAVLEIVYLFYFSKKKGSGIPFLKWKKH